MNAKTLLRAATAAILLTAIPLSAAHSVTSPSPSSSAQSQRLTNLKSKGALEIDRRLANLNSALAKLKASTKLNKADKDALIKQIETEIAGLTALKTELSAATDLASARTDIASIVTQYRVYALMLPKVRMVASADRFAVVEDKLDALAAKLQAKVDAAKAAGQDVTTMQKSLNDMKAKIASARTASDAIVPKLLALQPTDYNSNHAVLVSYRASLKTAHQDLKSARDLAKSVIDSLKASK